ncbi:Fic family protein [Azonexus caeni]|uniref:Fic family protein n=1 Tax=Azonexus caeni TaxID=266126 RepID=UPI003A882EC5
MARPRLTPRQKLARALTELHGVLGADRGVVRGPQLTNANRVLLLETGYLREILKGWYFVSDPTAEAGDTTPFYANFWEYLARYLGERFATGYCLTAEHSLLRHARQTVIPATVNVMLASSQSQVQELAFGHTIGMFPGKSTFPTESQTQAIDGLRCMSIPLCLVSLPPRHFATHGREIQIVMTQLQDPGPLAALVDVNRAGLARILSAYRQVKRDDFADAVLSQLAGLGIQLKTDETPFAATPIYTLGQAGRSPLYARIRALWEQHRESVIACRPDNAVLDLSPADYLARVQAIRTEDAYHSLSIERYRVTPELIRKVADEAWDPVSDAADQKQVAAMAAKGYLDAFELVRDAAAQAYAQRTADPGLSARLFASQHQTWYQKLFGPSVDAGILTVADLVGYRRQHVFLRGSLHSPPHHDAVLDGMTALCECLAAETDAFVRAVLGHWLFGFVHPYMDGNGRTARFTMNVLLAGGGYPWTVIRVDDRDEYMRALESASANDDLTAFAGFIAAQVVRAAKPGLVG